MSIKQQKYYTNRKAEIVKRYNRVKRENRFDKELCAVLGKMKTEELTALNKELLTLR